MTLTGVVDSIIYKNQENGYTVLEIETKNGTEVIVGVLPTLGEGEQIEVEGEYTNHASYGKQFSVTSFKSSLPVDETAIFRYLASGVIKGIKAATAKNIINRFGPESLDILENQPEKIAEVKGITFVKALKLSEQMKASVGVKNILLTFQQYGLTPAAAMKTYKKWGSHALEILRENPYRLCEIQGIGFEKADSIARKMNIGGDSVYRVRAGIFFVLEHNLLQNGHTFQPKTKLCDAAVRLLEIEFDSVMNVIDTMIVEKSLIYKEKIGNTDGVYLRRIYDCERAITERMLLSAKLEKPYPGDFEADIFKAETALEIKFAQNQRAAIKNSLCGKVMILTGGPGTGKTTTLNGIIYTLQLKGHSFLLAAPTGRAAKRMTELTGKEAKTIHRLLEYAPDGGHENFGRNRENPLKADYLIIDESSMIDLPLFCSLLEAVPMASGLILVGDANQLPPVGPGSVFRDLIKSGIINTVELNEIFRQSESSLIVRNAHEIINGRMPECRDTKNDFFFMPVNTPSELLSTVTDLYIRRLPNAYGYDSKTDIQIICPTKKTETGSFSLNMRLQNAANPADPRKREYKFRDTVFREGDKVMQIRNNYDAECENGSDERGVFNGDIGIIDEIREYENTITVRFDERRIVYTSDMLDDLELAYAITVHKSQGSEWNAVVLPLMEGYDMLFTRNLLYTAVTRAKNLLIIVGAYSRVKQMVMNITSDKRYCGLRSMMTELESNEQNS